MLQMSTITDSLTPIRKCPSFCHDTPRQVVLLILSQTSSYLAETTFENNYPLDHPRARRKHHHCHHHAIAVECVLPNSRVLLQTRGGSQGENNSRENEQKCSDDVDEYELKEIWKELKESTDATFEECPLNDMHIPSCDLDTFISLFLENDAPHSIGTYQTEKVGDTEVVTSSWEEETDENSRQRRRRRSLASSNPIVSRTIRYRHAVNAPMAPPSAVATKSQTLRKFGRHGVMMETVTQVMDVPKTDCFIVEDRIMVEPSKKGGLVLKARFGIRFVKRTMFRPIIQKTTRGEFESWFHGLGEFVMESLLNDTHDI